MAYITFEHIDQYYGSQHVLKDLNLSVEKGAFVTLLGPSGCGKSTLLRCLAGLEPVSHGRILLDGEDITHKAPRVRHVGMIFQQYSLFPTMTVAGNIAFGLKIQGVCRSEIAERVREVLEIVDLKGSEKKYPSQLSGGEQQRVALCRSLVTKPKVLLMDEPFSAIDAKLRKELQTRIKEIHEQLGMTTLFVTHDQDEAMTMSDTIHLMRNGIIEQSASPMELYAQPKTPFAASFMGNYNILSAQEYLQLTGEPAESDSVCIRPELITMSGVPLSPDADSSVAKGIVAQRIPQGNTILYWIQIGNLRLKCYLLFDRHTQVLFETGEEVWLRIYRQDLLTYSY